MGPLPRSRDAPGAGGVYLNMNVHDRLGGDCGRTSWRLSSRCMPTVIKPGRQVLVRADRGDGLGQAAADREVVVQCGSLEEFHAGLWQARQDEYPLSCEHCPPDRH